MHLSNVDAVAERDKGYREHVTCASMSPVRRILQDTLVEGARSMWPSHAVNANPRLIVTSAVL